MLVIISDLHFEEEKSRNIEDPDPARAIRMPRNIQLSAFTKIFCRLDEQARRDRARQMDLVLAGDIFDLHRTALWFENNDQNVRPYVSAAGITADLENKILEILQAINEQERPVAQILAAFRRLANEQIYLDADGEERQFCVPVKLHYIPGNHDRLVNATPAIRRTVREYLGLPPCHEPFCHVLSFPEERTMIRHGHEYDSYNFSQDYRGKEIPFELPAAAYDDPPFGDFVTVEVASRISHEFCQYHGRQNILADPLLRSVYEHILEFDDLRPMKAILNYLLYMPDSDSTPEEIWQRALKPVICQLLDEIHDHPFLRQSLGKMNKRGKFIPIFIAQLYLALRAWRWLPMPLKVVEWVSDQLLRRYEQEAGPEILVAHEKTVQSREHLFVVAGHTHQPNVKLLRRLKDGDEQYYVDTGTWRRQIPADSTYKSFGRIKSLTYAVIYGPDEDPGSADGRGKVASLDYWSGVTERWVKQDAR